MKSSYSYEGETADEVMEAHYLDLQADHRTQKEVESELQWAYEELKERAAIIEMWQDRYTTLSHLYWEVQ